VVEHADRLARGATLAFAKTSEGELKNIPVDQMERNSENPRLLMRTGELENLLRSIKRYGVQVPVTVFKKGNRYILIDGERRWICARKLGLKTIPAIVQREPSELENLLVMFNIHSLREQWDLLTIALKLPRVIDLLAQQSGKHPTEEQLAAYTGLGRGIIRRSKLLLDLPQKYKDLILEELRKPKSRQRLTEDFFIEMERSLKSVGRRIPGVIDDINRVRDVLVEKYQNGTIENVVHLRMVAKISLGPKLGVPSQQTQKVLRRLFQANSYSITQAFADSAELAYNERDLITRTNSLIEALDFVGSAVQRNQVLRKSLRRLSRTIAKLLGD
jgi:ParB/RepB/Spo0J family partition protein